MVTLSECPQCHTLMPATQWICNCGCGTSVVTMTSADARARLVNQP